MVRALVIGVLNILVIGGIILVLAWDSSEPATDPASQRYEEWIACIAEIPTDEQQRMCAGTYPDVVAREKAKAAEAQRREDAYWEPIIQQTREIQACYATQRESLCNHRYYSGSQAECLDRLPDRLEHYCFPEEDLGP